MEDCYYILLVETLTEVITHELDYVANEIDVAKSERKGNISPEYFNFLNGKLEGLSEVKNSLVEIAKTIKENYEIYSIEGIGIRDDDKE